MLFKKIFLIHFHTNCEISINDIEVQYKKEIPQLPLLERDGYNFRGWFTDSKLEDEFSDIKMPKNDIDLYAKWEAITLDEFLKEINFFSKTSNILRNLQNDYEGVPEFRDVNSKTDSEEKPKKKAVKKKTTTKKSTKKKTTKKGTTKKITKKEDTKEEANDIVEEANE